MMSDNCIACQTEKHFLGKANGLIIDVCPNCGLGETRGKSRLQYHDYHRDTDYKLNQNQFKNIFSRRVKIINQFKKHGSVLEVGSSTGLLLSLLKDSGWSAQGIEPSSEASKTAAKRGTPTVNTIFEKIKLPPHFFDLVVFNHVLEHMVDPLAVLQKVRAILKKDGILFIDVPNFGSLSARVWGARWKYILPKEHRWHFTKNSLERILAKTGFKLVCWEARSGIWDYGNPWLEIWQSFRGLKKRFIFNLITAIPSFIVTLFNQGSGLTIIAKRSTQ